MPVYLRHANLLSAPSLNSEIPENDVWDFLQDPTLMVDELPQPFRLVNKLVFQLIDIAWETIDDRESEKIAEAARYKPPEYKCGLQTEVILLVLVILRKDGAIRGAALRIRRICKCILFAEQV